MHLDSENNLTCTHSVAECITSMASEALRVHGGDWTIISWGPGGLSCRVHGAHPDDAGAMHTAHRASDPFQNGEHTTLPSWHVGAHLAMVLGATSK